MSTQEIANRLVELVKQGQFENAQRELFATDAISSEPASSGQPIVTGLDAIISKGQNFRSSVETFHSLNVSEALVSFNHIALRLTIEVTFKGQERSTMDELIVYQVKEEMIVTEHFFY
jgi:hypothetical protein